METEFYQTSQPNCGLYYELYYNVTFTASYNVSVNSLVTGQDEQDIRIVEQGNAQKQTDWFTNGQTEQTTQTGTIVDRKVNELFG
jgi:hypothetical protein